MVTYLTGKLYPDKTLSLGFMPKKTIGVDERDYNREYGEQLNSYEYKTAYYGKTVKKEHVFFDKPIVPARFTKSLKSSQPVKPYGLNGITAYGKKAVKNISLLLQEKYGRNRLGFCTATIPELGRENLEIILQCWGDIVRKFFQELKRECARKGVDLEYVCCTEIQEKRFARTDLAYPHLHWVYVCKQHRRGEFTISADKMRSVWKRVIVQSLPDSMDMGNSKEIHFRASIDCQIVKKSASAYLGKYLSKGCKVIASMQEKGYEKFPKQWWSTCTICRNMFKKAIFSIPSEVCGDIFYNLGEWLAEGSLVWFQYVLVDIQGEEKVMGIVATLSNEGYSKVKLGGSRNG